MKKLFLFLFMLLHIQILAQWVPNTALSFPLYISDAYLLNQQNLFVTGNRGVLLKSSDYGNTWSRTQTPTTLNLYGVYFSDSLNGILSAENGYLLRTTDGGVQWQVTRPFPGINLRRIYFITPQTGFILGAPGQIYRTTDSGGTWTVVPLPNNLTAGRISFVNENIGMIATGSSPLRSTDGGATWQIMDPGAGITFTSIAMLKPGLAFAGANSRRIFISTDNGITWVHQFTASGSGTSEFTDIATADSSYVVFLRVSGPLIISEDGGNTFTERPFPTGYNSLDKLFLSGRNNIFVMNQYNSLHVSLNKGVSWASAYHTIKSDFKSMDAFSNGYILVGAKGHVQYVSSPTHAPILPMLTISDLYAVSVMGHSTGFAVGSRGTILQGNDNNSSWSVKNSGIETDLFGVSRCPGNGNVAAAVGDSGTILWTVQNGNFWGKRVSGVTVCLRNVRLINPFHAIAIGDSGTVLLTSDGGVNWAKIPVNTTESLTSIASVQGRVIIGGKNGVSFRSNDSGRTWTENHIGVSSDIISLQYVSNLTVRAAIAPGKLYVSSNGGQSWHYDYNFEGKTIAACFFKTLNTGSIATANAEVYSHTVPVPVELTGFSAERIDGKVHLTWSTATEINNRGFEVEKSKDSKLWSTAGFIAGAGNSTESRTYTYIDSYPEFGNNYYRLKQIDYNGEYEYSSVAEAVHYMDFSLSDNYPNPFNPSTQIVYTLPYPSRVVIELFDILGNSAGVAVNGDFDAGTHTAVISSRGLASGVYIYRFTAGNFTQTKKMTVVK